MDNFYGHGKATIRGPDRIFTIEISRFEILPEEQDFELEQEMKNGEKTEIRFLLDRNPVCVRSGLTRLKRGGQKKKFFFR